ncbi:MAG: cyclic nucleotide-binding domain-containing protein [Nitrospinota bacterium]
MKIINAIPNLPVFEEFSNDEMQELLGMDGVLRNYWDGEFIIKQGEISTALFVLIDGVARITKNNAPKVDLNTLKPGTIFGESPFINHSPRLTNVIAKGEVTVLRLDSRKFDELNPAIANKFQNQLNKLLVSRLNNMNDQLAKVQAGINHFVEIYDGHRKKMEEDPYISEEIKMVQRLWSNYFSDLRTK